MHAYTNTHTNRSRPGSSYGFNLGDRIINPKLFVTRPPVIFDPVEDRIRSRWLGVLTLSLVPTILSTIFLVGFWGSFTAMVTESTPNVHVLFVSGDPFILDQSHSRNMSIKVLVNNANNWPMRGVPITARVLGRVLPTELQRRFPYCHPTLAGTLRAKSASKICDISIQGGSATTNRDGVAWFDQLTFTSVLPGAYQVSFEVYGAMKNVTLWLTVKGAVSALAHATPHTHDRTAGTDITFDQSSSSAPWKIASFPLPAVRAVVATTNTSRWSNLTIVAVSADIDQTDDGYYDSYAIVSENPSLSVRPDSGVLLTGNTARTSDNGVAVFDQLGVVGYDRPYMLLVFVCHGEILVWSKRGVPLVQNASETSGTGSNVFDTLAYVKLPTSAPAVTAAEGGPFQVFFLLVRVCMCMCVCEAAY
jgi:hypothetical protein